MAYKEVNTNGTYKVINYLSRPVIRCRPGSSGFLKTYGFVEAIQALDPLNPNGLKMVDNDFAEAYKIAGRKFLGLLEETFLILSDSSPLSDVPGTGPATDSVMDSAMDSSNPQGAAGLSRQRLLGQRSHPKRNRDDDGASVASSNKVS